jgi:CopG family nickel-responsive transcriptional regulator
MSDLYRFGISIDARLIERFDAAVGRKGYTNRSEAIRDLIRDFLVREEWGADEEIVGTITLVYDHHVRELPSRLTELQHHESSSVLSNLHIHLDHDNCLEVIAIRGRARKVQAFADELIGSRGVKHGKLAATTTGKRLT